MIISVADAQEINVDITQEELDAFEQTIRALTNNNFQNKNVRFENVSFPTSSTIAVSETPTGLRVGDTIEVNYSLYNNGLYLVSAISGNTITVQGVPFVVETTAGVMVTLVSYPADIRQGIKKLIAYDVKMADKIGVKSETISRMSTTYYDVTAAETIDGYPSAMLSFLKKHEKMRW